MQRISEYPENASSNHSCDVLSPNYQNNFAICGFGYKTIKNQINQCIYRNILKVEKINEKEEKSSEELSSIKDVKKKYDIDFMLKNN